MREKRIDAVIGGLETVQLEGYSPNGPAPRPADVAEHRQPAFYRVHFVNAGGRPQIAWRLADCPKHAVDVVIHDCKAQRIVAVREFTTRQELQDNLPPGRGIRCLFPPADLRLGHSLGLLFETDL